jgi:hypothetical protein
MSKLQVSERLYSKQRTIYGALIIIFIVASIIAYYVVKDAVNKTIEQQALDVAEIVATQATTSRSVYSSKVANKLEQEGSGPHVNSHEMPGYVPIPAQFLKMVGLASAKNANNLYQYRPVSKWNLEETQEINDAFLKGHGLNWKSRINPIPPDRLTGSRFPALKYKMAYGYCVTCAPMPRHKCHV